MSDFLMHHKRLMMEAVQPDCNSAPDWGDDRMARRPAARSI